MVSFIIPVNDYDEYVKCEESIRKLKVPDNDEIEIIAVVCSSSMADAYNHGLLKAEGRIKIYLHQDVTFLDDRFLLVVLKTFALHPDIGVLGVTGCRKMPDDGIWWNGDMVGRFMDSHTGEMKEYIYTNSRDVEYVEGLDGLLLATQYDVGWYGEGWHFYDMIECQRMRWHGYECAVLPSPVTWIKHDCGICDMTRYEELRKKFVREYL